MKYSTWIGALALLAGLVAPSGLVGNAFGYGLYDDAFTETVYVVPTSSVVSTSYVVPTSYYAPTSYYVPTSYYLPTSYYVPTSYVSTYLPTTYSVASSAYLVPTYYTSSRRLARRPVYSTTAYYTPTVYYRPTSYYIPTVYEYPVETSVACDDAAPPSKSRPATSSASPTSSSKATRSAERPPRSVTSSAIGDDSSGNRNRATSNEVPANNEVVVPDPPNQINLDTPPAPLPANDRGAGNAAPVNPAAPVREPAKAKPADGAAAAEKDDIGDLPLAPEATERRDARKPVTPTPGLGNILSGVVEAKRTNVLLSGVTITLSNRLRTFPDRIAESDALGRFAIRLFDGDWSIKVRAKDGRDVEVKRITVTNGQITDDQGRDVPSLIIKR